MLIYCPLKPLNKFQSIFKSNTNILTVFESVVCNHISSGFNELMHSGQNQMATMLRFPQMHILFFKKGDITSMA